MGWGGVGRGARVGEAARLAHLLPSAPELMLQLFVSPQLSLQPTQVWGHLTGEACGFLLRRGDGQGCQE